MSNNQPPFHNVASHLAEEEELLRSDLVIPRGAIKAFREKLNKECALKVLWRNGRRGQRTRLYGDYLYSQDREMFMVNLREWLHQESLRADVRSIVAQYGKTLEILSD